MFIKNQSVPTEYSFNILKETCLKLGYKEIPKTMYVVYMQLQGVPNVLSFTYLYYRIFKAFYRLRHIVSTTGSDAMLRAQIVQVNTLFYVVCYKIA